MVYAKPIRARSGVMKVLITGASGFVGRHLCRDLQKAGHEVIMTGLMAETVAGLGHVLHLDITNGERCSEFIQEHRPDALVHLAGLAHTAQNDKNLELLFDVNVAGAANVARAMSTISTSDSSKPRSLLFVSSAFVYGDDHPSGILQCSESTHTAPRTKYGSSKLAAEFSVRFFDSDRLSIYIARPFNHIGPGQDSSFVVPGFANRIKCAPNGGTIATGNLTAIRDFTDVRDIVRGYRSILELSPRERVFVFGSGRGTQIQSVLDQLSRISGKNISTTVDPLLLRSEERAAYIANATLADKVLGWTPGISTEQSLRDVWNELNSN
jgi:GDP-4-dehydro-6-deoxy-D-mannose reductase